MSKPVGIYQLIGHRPILAFGNSDSDMQMNEYTMGGKGRRLGLFVYHTDANCEFAYDRKSHVGKLDKTLDQADGQWLEHWGYEEGLEGGVSRKVMNVCFWHKADIQKINFELSEGARCSCYLRTILQFVVIKIRQLSLTIGEVSLLPIPLAIRAITRSSVSYALCASIGLA